jgi:hypothetical protein
MKTYTSADGTPWTVEVILPGASNAMVLFRHPDGRSSGKDRYNWVLTQGPEARSVTGRVAPKKVLESLKDADIATLFRRSMAVTRADSSTTPRARSATSRR